MEELVDDIMVVDIVLSLKNEIYFGVRYCKINGRMLDVLFGIFDVLKLFLVIYVVLF